MSEYIVSARKYRPQTFDEVVGQEALTTTLKNAIRSGKLAHAYLFCGPRGVGKTTCARIFAKTINCLHPLPNGEACNECESCRAFNEQRSFNIQELDAASNNSVEEIRQLIEQVRIPPQVGKYKVFIIDEVHMLSTAAFNAFLKTLEEPPQHVIFILATTEKHKILPTILSRCQIYDFNRMEIPDIVKHLEKVANDQHLPYDVEALNVIAQKADGGMRDALSIFDQVASFGNGKITYEDVLRDLNVLDYEYYFKITEDILAHNVPDLLLTFNEILNKGFQGSQFVQGLAGHFRNLLVSRDAVTLPLLEVADSVKKRYREMARRLTPAYLYKAMKLCNDCDLNYRVSTNKRLLVELTLIQLEQAQEGDTAPGSRPSGRNKILNPIRKEAAAGAASSSGAASARPSSNPEPSAAGNSQSSEAYPQSASDSAQAYVTSSQSQTPSVQTIPQTPTAAPNPAIRPGTASTMTSSGNSNPTPQNFDSPQNNRESGSVTAGGPALHTGRKLPTFKRGASQISVRLKPAVERTVATGKTSTVTAAATAAVPENGNATAPAMPAAPRTRPIPPDELNLAWLEYAMALPPTERAVSERMKIIRPTMTDATHVNIEVENENVKNYFKSFVPQIIGYMRNRLQNDLLEMTISVHEGEIVLPATPQQRFLKMSKENPNLLKLKKMFGLDIM